MLARNNLTLEKAPAVVQFVAYNTGILLIVYGWMSNSAGQPFLYYGFSLLYGAWRSHITGTMSNPVSHDR